MKTKALLAIVCIAVGLIGWQKRRNSPYRQRFGTALSLLSSCSAAGNELSPNFVLD